MKPLEKVPLSAFTTLRLGGDARYFVECRDHDDILAAIRFAESKKVGYHVLGGGSNTIFLDEGYDGLVMKIALRGIQFVRESDCVNLVVAAGEQWDDFVRLCMKTNLAGVECLSGIPGLVGAAPIQNVGAYGQEVSETIVAVKAIDRRTFHKVVFANNECRFSYRRSRFNNEDTDRFIITEVTFALRPFVGPDIRYPELRAFVSSNVDLEALHSGREKLGAIRDAVLSLRRRKSMVIEESDPNTRSAGSFFKNPTLSKEQFAQLDQLCRELGIYEHPPAFPSGECVKVPAAWLLEKAGFYKGCRKGAVGVSSNHTLALVNFGGTARELLELAREIQTAVHQKFGIMLEREPVLVQ